MTNYDVIESYVIDFTKGAITSTNGDAVISGQKITITNIKNVAHDIFALLTKNKDFTLSIKVDGQTKNNQTRLIYQTENGEYVSVYLNNGINKIDISNCVWLAIKGLVAGECNITITQLPTSILRDFSGNGHDAYLYGFKGKLNSGIGIYAQDFKKWVFGSAINTTISTKSYDRFHIVKKEVDSKFGFTVGIQKSNYYNKPYKLKFNINKQTEDVTFNVVSTDGNLKTTNVFKHKINNNSIIDIPVINEKDFNNQEQPFIYYGFYTNKDIEIDVKLIPIYSNQLCYDGKSYAVAYNLPIMTDYTVIADRTWFDEKVDNGVFMSKSLGQNGAFIYQTKNKYNKQIIYPGDKPDTDTLFIGTIRKNDNRTFIGCHRDILLFNRTLTEYEISWVKNNLMCIEQQKPDKMEEINNFAGTIKFTNVN